MSVADFESENPLVKRGLSPQEVLMLRFTELQRALAEDPSVHILPSSILTSDPTWRPHEPLPEESQDI